MTKYYKKSVSIYIEYFCSLLEYKSDIPLHTNRVIQLSCMIIGNYFEGFYKYGKNKKYSDMKEEGKDTTNQNSENKEKSESN